MTDNRTTELREKLDSLGIEHLDSDLPNNKQTRWNKGADGWGACYIEITRCSILPADSIIDNRTLRIYDCTPEQAIAATLGSGTLTAEQVSKAVYAHSIHADCADADWQAIADELNARAERTCMVESKIFIEGEYVPCPYYEYEMACGGQFRWDEVEPPKFCPNCGARVIGTEAVE